MNPNSNSHFPFNRTPAARQNGDNRSGNARFPYENQNTHFDDQTLESALERLSLSNRPSPNPAPDFGGQIADRSGLFSNGSGFTPRNNNPPVSQAFFPPENSVTMYSMGDSGFPVSQNRRNDFDYDGFMGYPPYATYFTQTDPLDSNRRVRFNGFLNPNGIWVDDLPRIPPRRTNNFDSRSRMNFDYLI